MLHGVGFANTRPLVVSKLSLLFLLQGGGFTEFSFVPCVSYSGTSGPLISLLAGPSFLTHLLDSYVVQNIGSAKPPSEFLQE